MDTLNKLQQISLKVRNYVNKTEPNVQIIKPVHFRYYYLEEVWCDELAKTENGYKYVDLDNRMDEYDFFYDNVREYKDYFKDFHIE